MLLLLTTGATTHLEAALDVGIARLRGRTAAAVENGTGRAARSAVAE
ncbi:hypothetical protein ACFWA9_07625 [Kitasatospora sp. NPDC059973]